MIAILTAILASIGKALAALWSTIPSTAHYCLLAFAAGFVCCWIGCGGGCHPIRDWIDHRQENRDDKQDDGGKRRKIFPIIREGNPADQTDVSGGT